MNCVVLLATLLAPIVPAPDGADLTKLGPAPQLVYFSTRPWKAFGLDDKDEPLILRIFFSEKGEHNLTVDGNVRRLMADKRLYQGRLLGDRDEIFTCNDGTRLTKEEAILRLGRDTVAVATTDGKPISAGWRQFFADDAIQIHSPQITGRALGTPMYKPRRPPPPRDLRVPRIVKVTPDAEGRILVTRGSYFVDLNESEQLDPTIPVYLNNTLHLSLKNVAEVRQTFSLDDLPFQAMTADGRIVPKEKALQRLKKGGVVVVAAENERPDSRYLKVFKPDQLVIFAPELVPFHLNQ